MSLLPEEPARRGQDLRPNVGLALGGQLFAAAIRELKRRGVTVGVTHQLGVKNCRARKSILSANRTAHHVDGIRC
jgi:hypothetical protein